ncbi:MAG: methyltransferase domain-containing protein [Polyangiaceae bacterium]|nr:methyltransferase domain-containing protein [Polyangiaceae bacterium]
MGADPHLRAAFEAAAPEHFAWQTGAPFVADRERELVRAAFLPLGDRLLDLGCGEGATLVHLGAPDGAVGVDLFEEKIAFARARLPDCRFLVAPAEALPFEDRSFDQVIVRDVIHHVPDPARLVDECHRVLSAGGRIDVLEPCRYNPLIFLHAVANRAERGELRSTMRFLEGHLARRFRVVATERLQALPVHRLVFHPSMGSPRLAERPAARWLVSGVERIAAAAMPSWAWAYLHLRAVREG